MSVVEGDNVRYVAVARLEDRVPIAEYAAIDKRHLPKSLFDEKLDKVLRSGRVREHARLTITDREVGSIHYDSDPTCLYLVVCSKEYPQRTAFKFLGQVQREFDADFGGRISGARHSSLSRQAKNMFADLCRQYNQVENVDKASAVSMQVEEVKGAMQNNIQSVLRNQENLETLLDKSDAMRNEATSFQRTAVQVKKKYWWQNLKLQIVIVVIIVLIITLVLVFALKK